MTKLQSFHTGFDVLTVLSEDNPGALSMLLSLVKEADRIAPDSVMGWVGYCLQLDNLGIYGPELWMLFSDVCGRSIEKTIGILEALRLGLLSKMELKKAIHAYGNGVDVDEIITQVRAICPTFWNEDANATHRQP